eukprot:3519520-Rhodomonas_salina.1
MDTALTSLLTLWFPIEAEARQREIDRSPQSRHDGHGCLSCASWLPRMRSYGTSNESSSLPSYFHHFELSLLSSTLGVACRGFYFALLLCAAE